MPYGKGTYGNKVGRPPKKKPKMVSGQKVDEKEAARVERLKKIARANRKAKELLKAKKAKKKAKGSGKITSGKKKVTLGGTQKRAAVAAGTNKRQGGGSIFNRRLVGHRVTGNRSGLLDVLLDRDT